MIGRIVAAYHDKKEREEADEQRKLKKKLRRLQSQNLKMEKKMADNV